MSQKTKRVYSPAATLRQMTLINMQKRAEKPLFLYKGSGDAVESVSYGDFYYLTERMISSLHARNLKGCRIAVIGETCPEWLTCFVSAISAGCVVVPLDKEILFSELGGFLERSAADVLFLSPKYAKKYGEIKETGALDGLRYILTADHNELENADEDTRVMTLSAFCEGYAPEAVMPSEIMRAHPRGDMSIMLFTSGTTGTSKCVMLSERNLMSCASAACESVNFSADDTLLSVLPMHHTYELAITVAEMLYGITVAINDSLKHILKNLQLFKPTGLVLVPMFVSTFHKKIWDEVKKKGKESQFRTAVTTANAFRFVGVDMSERLFSDVRALFGGNLNKIICGGAAMDPEAVKTFDALGIEICEGYGITECSPLVAVNPYFHRKKGSVGPSVPCCDVRIDVETTDASGRSVGEVLVKGENVMIGYFDNDEANNDVFTDDGWFRTGDIGYLDADGYLFLTGRKKTVIVLENGKNVFPEEIEEYLGKIGTICECVVVGRTKKETGEVVLTAVIYPDFKAYPEGEPVENIADDIKASVLSLNRKLPSFKQIRNIEIRMTEFEKTTSKKIKRFLVK